MHYLSNRTFKMWTYSVSHGVLILRSPQIYKDQKGYSADTNHNIDVEFWEVSYLNLPETFHDFNIKVLEENIPEWLIEYLRTKDDKVFEIQSKKKLFYVIAAGCVVGKNFWENQDRVSDPYLEHIEIITKS